jgi:acyl-coenzyme A thioesterase 13
MTAPTPLPGWIPLVVPGDFPAHLGQFWALPGTADAPMIGAFIGPLQSNSQHVAHGGFLLAFADLAITVGVLGVTLHLAADFLSPAALGEWVEAQVITRKRTHNVVFADAVARVGEREILRANGVFKPIREPAPWQTALFA